jgi:tartrate dehydratase alpha subunit/fumarate hydratase class I-like protein
VAQRKANYACSPYHLGVAIGKQVEISAAIVKVLIFAINIRQVAGWQ